MNIYKVERTDGYGYDDYSAFICVAKDENDARMFFPYNDGNEEDNELRLLVDEKGNVTGNKDMVDGNVFNRQDHSWVDNISKLKVTKLGDAGAEHDKAKVILSSFHAG